MQPVLGIVHERKADGFTFLSIDTDVASYQGISWHALGDYGKRKFRNWLVMARPKERLKIIYKL